MIHTNPTRYRLVDSKKHEAIQSLPKYRSAWGGSRSRRSSFPYDYILLLEDLSCKTSACQKNNVEQPQENRIRHLSWHDADDVGQKCQASSTVSLTYKLRT